MSFTFSTVSDVLPLGGQRVYVPRGARPHVAWSTTQSSRVLGSRCRLKGDGTAARERARDGDGAAADESRAGASTSAAERSLASLATIDATFGTRLTFYRDPTTPSLPLRSAVIPSQRRITALWTPATCAEVDSDSCVSAPLFVSDEVGATYAYAWTDPVEPVAKRPRGDGVPPCADGEDGSGGVWTAIAPAHSSLSSDAARMGRGASDTASLFAVTRGAPGWAGLGALDSGETRTAAAAVQLVSAREFFHDVRLIDPARQTVVRTYSTTHAPTGMFCPSAQAAPHCTLIVEGCLATLYDVRCPSAVLSLGEVYAAQAEWLAAKDAAAAASAEAERLDSGEVASGAGVAAAAAATAARCSSPPPPPLVPGRLTSTVGQVRDVCGTANPFEVACAVDRALCVYDLRKFNRLFTSSSVLKYVVGSVASVAGGRGVVCAGIDAEVRLIPLHEKHDPAAAEQLSLAARVVSQAQQKRRQRSDALKATEQSARAGGEGDVDGAGPGGTFRTRLSTSVSCTTVWQGGWVTTCNDGGAAAVGVSVDGELFLAQ
ncbi:hypothetical protein NESM_000779600 [Novymonas esmeraldas]|uniref:Uncharacterized protein n=1 Tax=Novymonas esmeraldas TaxID=1808958 RepID=A0AAW0EXD1_9TRYP